MLLPHGKHRITGQGLQILWITLYMPIAMLQFSNQFAKQWADESVVDLDVYVVDTHTGKNVASVHFEKPR